MACGQVRVWDAEEGNCSVVWSFGRPIASLSFHAGGDYLAVASGHKVSHLVTLKPLHFGPYTPMPQWQLLCPGLRALGCLDCRTVYGIPLVHLPPRFCVRDQVFAALM